MIWKSWIRTISICLALLWFAPAWGRAQVPAPAAAAPPTPTPAPAPAAAAPTTNEAAVQQDLERLAAKLADESAKQDERDEAARRLVARQRDEARQILRAALVSAGNRNGQLAVARALTRDPHPDDSFVIPLFALLGPDRALTEAAAQALSAYKGNAEVLSRLIAVATARQQPDSVRIASIKAIGTFLDKRAAETLVTLLSSDDESSVVRSASADALAELTGLRENGRDVQRWQRWWQANSPKPEADWRAELVNERALRLEQVQLRYGQLADEIRSIFNDQYQLVPEAQKPQMLQRLLGANEPILRGLGARLVFDDVSNNRTIPTATRDQLRKMVGDSSPDVRIEVAGALRALNDSASLGPLLMQMAQETDPDVRAALAKALAPIRDLKALPELRKLLHDESYAAAEAAADAIKQFGSSIREKQPDDARTTALELKQVLDQRTGAPGSTRLREALVEAMVKLKEPSLQNTFYGLLRSRETREVRRSSLKGLGELGDPKSADVIINSLEDPDSTVRLQAIDALGKVGSTEHAEILYHRLSAADETDSSVRAQAWTVLKKLLLNMSVKELPGWADRVSDDPEKRLFVLQTQADKQAAAKDADGLAYTQQNIGETLMKLKQPAEAAKYFRPALDHWLSRNQERMVTESLISQHMSALLLAKKYADAVAFGGEMVRRDRSQQETVGPAFRNEAQRLVSSKDPRSAYALIQETKKMDPPLSPRHLHDLEDIESDIRKQIGETAPPPTPGTEPKPGPQSARRPPPQIHALRLSSSSH